MIDDKCRIGIDVGGTFTDIVAVSEAGTVTFAKATSTPSDPSIGVMNAVERLADELGISSKNLLSKTESIVHGTTVATNAALQGRGVETAYITNRGIADVLRIGRQTRSKLYDLRASKLEPPIKQSLTFEVDARLDANGNEVTALNESQLTQLKKAVELRKPDSIAINLLFSPLLLQNL